MKKNIQASVEARIRELGQELAAFRRMQGGPSCHPPTKIWDEAIALCRVAPLSAVASGISVSPQGLRNRIKLAKESSKGPVVAFMEISPAALSMSVKPPLSSVPQTIQEQSLSRSSRPPITPVIELERRDGLKLRLIDFPQQEISLASLLTQFMGASS
jgi:hypothetical protein